jgi:hypothetical protein
VPPVDDPRRYHHRWYWAGTFYPSSLLCSSLFTSTAWWGNQLESSKVKETSREWCTLKQKALLVQQLHAYLRCLILDGRNTVASRNKLMTKKSRNVVLVWDSAIRVLLTYITEGLGTNFCFWIHLKVKQKPPSFF